MDLGIQGRGALVTGSHRGTGSAIAEALAREGARVVVHGFEEGQPDEVVERLRAEGHRADGVHGNLMSDAGADALCAQLAALGVPVSILVNNYGVAEGGSWSRSSAAEWIDLYEKNVLSGVRMVQRLSPAMQEAGFGRIIFLGTVGGLRPAARMPHYYAAKSALANVCVSLAKSLAGTGVTVNLVSPGIIATAEVKAAFLAQAEKKGWGADWESVEPAAVAALFPNPSGRAARVEEVADLVAFLASARAGYINGANHRIDGGASDVALG